MSDNPAPHESPHDLWDNPMGTDGFEFVEYTGPDPQQLAALFEQGIVDSSAAEWCGLMRDW